MTTTKVNLANTVEGILPVANGGTGSSTGVSPGGSTTQVQFNNAGAFGGDSGFVYTGGNVGIGTSSPSAKLDLGTTVSKDVLLVYGGGAGSQYGLGISAGVLELYTSASGQITFNQRNGASYTERMRIDSSGNVGIGTSSPSSRLTVNGRLTLSGVGTSELYTTDSSGMYITSATSGGLYIASDNFTMFRKATTPFTEYMRIDSSGNVLVGTTATFSGGLSTQKVLSYGTSDDAGFSALRASANTGGSRMVLGKSRGATYTIVNSGDGLGILSFQGADGSTLIRAAEIAGEVDGTPGANDMPGRLVFSTTADGASSPTERMRITSSGNVGIGTSNPGQKLQVVDTNYNFSLRNDEASFVYLTSKGISGTTYGGFVFKGIRDSDGAEIERFRIGSAGQLGIGGANYGTSGQVLTSNGSGSAPTWTTVSSGISAQNCSYTGSLVEVSFGYFAQADIGSGGNYNNFTADMGSNRVMTGIRQTYNGCGSWSRFMRGYAIKNTAA